MQCVFLGYSNMHKGYKCLDVRTGRVYISRDVVFDEFVFPFANLHPNAGALLRAEINLLPDHLLNSSLVSNAGMFNSNQYASNSHSNSICELPVFSPQEPRGVSRDSSGPTTSSLDPNSVCTTGFGIQIGDTGALCDAVPAADPSATALDSSDPAPCGSQSAAAILPAARGTDFGASPPSPSICERVQTWESTAAGGSSTPTAAHVPSPSPTAAHAPSSSPVSSAPVPVVVAPDDLNVTRPRTRMQNNIRKPKQYTDGTVRYGMLTSAREPNNLQEALTDENWKAAMDEEFSAWMKNKTWHLVPPSQGTNIVDCKWVYKIKRKSYGSLDRYKARLVAKGFKQRYGIDYEETFSPQFGWFCL